MVSLAANRDDKMWSVPSRRRTPCVGTPANSPPAWEDVLVDVPAVCLARELLCHAPSLSGVARAHRKLSTNVLTK